MSVKRGPSLNKSKSVKVLKDFNDHATSKRFRHEHKRCFPFMEISMEMEPGKSLKDIDSNKLKSDIRRWAKAVAAYARQVSSRIGRSRRSRRISSSRDSSQVYSSS